MPLRGFKNSALEIDPKAVCTIEKGWPTVTMSCGHKVKAYAPRDAWHAALMHLRKPCFEHQLRQGQRR